MLNMPFNIVKNADGKMVRGIKKIFCDTKKEANQEVKEMREKLEREKKDDHTLPTVLEIWKNDGEETEEYWHVTEVLGVVDSKVLEGDDYFNGSEEYCGHGCRWAVNVLCWKIDTSNVSEVKDMVRMKFSEIAVGQLFGHFATEFGEPSKLAYTKIETTQYTASRVVNATTEDGDGMFKYWTFEDDDLVYILK